MYMTDLDKARNEAVRPLSHTALVFAGQTKESIFQPYPLAPQLAVPYLLLPQDSAHFGIAQERTELQILPDQ